MTRVLDRSGGLPARRAVARWAVRLYRREWRQQLMVTGLLAGTVAVAVFGIAASFNVISTAEADFGTANHRIQVRVAGPVPLPQLIDDLEDGLGPVEVIGHHPVPVPGSTTTLDLRAQDPSGPYSGPLLALLDGRYPQSSEEVAITTGAGDLLDVGIGETATVGGTLRQVVGIVENPADLEDEFVLAPAAEAASASDATILVSTTEERAAALPASVVRAPIERRPACHATLVCLSSDQSEQATAAAAALGLATILLLLVAFVAAAGFQVVAQRRLRQLGMLGATGADERQLRLVLLTNGAVVGAVAAVIGAAVGSVLWFVMAPAFESPSGHRIDRLHVPWPIVVAAMVLAIITSVLASRAPARRLARLSIVQALSGRPPAPRSTRRSLALALVLVTVGLVSLSQAIDIPHDEVTPPLLIGGTVALVVGVVWLSPSVVALLGRLARRLPVAPRLALRDLDRHRARSSAALAAISLGLAIPIAVTVLAGAAVNGAGEGNLSDRQLLVRIGDDPLVVPERDPQQLRALDRIVDQLALDLHATSTPLHLAVVPEETMTRGTEVLHPTVHLGRPVNDRTTRDVAPLYVGTAALDDLLHLPVAGGDVDVLTGHTGDLVLDSRGERGARPTVAEIPLPSYSSLPSAVITEAALARHGWEAAQGGWLIESDHPPTDEEVRAAWQQANRVGLTIETREDQSGMASLQHGATTAGFLVGLAVLALTLGLLRAETTNDRLVLSAAGATSTTNRTLLAATAAALAAAGVFLGGLAAYGGLAAGYASDPSDLAHVPTAHLVLLVLGLPLAAAAVSYALGGSGRRVDLRSAPLE